MTFLVPCGRSATLVGICSARVGVPEYCIEAGTGAILGKFGALFRCPGVDGSGENCW